MKTIGVAVITYKRPDSLLRCMDSLYSFCREGLEIAIFDDCSKDETLDLGKSFCNVFESPLNGGVVRNKNRALYYFTEINPKDYIIILEDDVVIVESGWAEQWVKAAELYGHINFSAPWFKDKSLVSEHLCGNGSVLEPDVYKIVTGQCTSLKASYIKETVGYLNPRFLGYGHGHVEWTNRFIANGYGGYRRDENFYYFAIGGGIEAPETVSHKTDAELERNQAIFEDIVKTQNNVFIERPWLDEKERAIFFNFEK